MKIPTKSYKEISIKKFIELVFSKSDLDDWYSVNFEDSDEDLFNRFTEFLSEQFASAYFYDINDDYIKSAIDDLNKNKKEAIKTIKECINKEVLDSYDNIVEDLFDAINDWEYNSPMYYYTTDLLIKAKKEAITKLYNKYCK